MIDIKQIKAGDVVESTNQFALIRKGVVETVYAQPERIVIKPLEADDTVHNITVYPKGYHLYQLLASREEKDKK